MSQSSKVQFDRLPRLDATDVIPTVVVDTREQEPLVFTRLPVVCRTLRTGDYTFAGGEELFAIERKSVADLVSCCVGENRERFERELHRLRGYRFKRLLIVGSQREVEQHRYRSNLPPKTVLHTLFAFEARYDVPVVWFASSDEAAMQIEIWAWWFAREIFKAARAIAQPVSRDNESVVTS